MTDSSATSTSPKKDAVNRSRSSVSRHGHAAPVLASEVLREDVAPLRPWERAFRIWDVVLGVVTLGMAGLWHASLVPFSTLGTGFAYGFGFLLLLLGAVPMPYPARGTATLLVGMGTVGLGLLGFGPLEGWLSGNVHPLWGASKVLAATALPAALLFRARYRAYMGARVALIVALAVALPAAVHAGMTVAMGPLAASILAGLTLAAILTSLFGFMGEGTTAASTAWAVFVLLVFGAEVIARSLWSNAGWTAFVGDLTAGIMLMVACTATSTGLFQMLATAFAADARRVDVLRKRQPSLHYANGVD